MGKKTFSRIGKAEEYTEGEPFYVSVGALSGTSQGSSLSDAIVQPDIKSRKTAHAQLGAYASKCNLGASQKERPPAGGHPPPENSLLYVRAGGKRLWLLRHLQTKITGRSDMKKFISLILVAVLLMLAIPTYVFATETDADTNTDTNTGDTNNESTVPTQTWAEAGKYDLSWAEDLITETATDGQSVVVDDKIYTCKYVTETYEIDTVEKLVGVAVLANAFYPTEDAEGNVTYKGVESFS